MSSRWRWATAHTFTKLSVGLSTQIYIGEVKFISTFCTYNPIKRGVLTIHPLPMPRSLKSRAIPYNAPSYSIGRHVFLSGNLGVLSGGTVILLTLVTMNIIYIISRCWNIQIFLIYGCALKNNVFTASFGTAYTTCHFQGMNQTPLALGFSKLVSFKFLPLKFSFYSRLAKMLNFVAS